MSLNNTIRTDCVYNREFFNFYDVPEVLLKKKMPKE